MVRSSSEGNIPDPAEIVERLNQGESHDSMHIVALHRLVVLILLVIKIVFIKELKWPMYNWELAY